jgi:hypothetical protein
MHYSVLNSFTNNKARSQFVLFIMKDIKNRISFFSITPVPFQLISCIQVRSVLLICIFSWSNNILGALGLTFHVPIFRPLFILPNCRELNNLVLTSFEFTTNFLQSKVVSFASNPHLENLVSVFMFTSDRVAQLNLPAPSSLFVAFHESLGCSEGFLTYLHTGHQLSQRSHMGPSFFMILHAVMQPTLSSSQYVGTNRNNQHDIIFGIWKPPKGHQFQPNYDVQQIVHYSCNDRVWNCIWK